MSYTRVQNTPEMYNGNTIAGSRLPLIAAHPNKAPQLKVRPRKAWGCSDVFAFSQNTSQNSWNADSRKGNNKNWLAFARSGQQTTLPKM